MTFWCPALGFPCGGTGVPSSLRTEPGAFDGSKRGFRLFENCAMTGVQVLLTDGSVACRILTFERVLVVRRAASRARDHASRRFQALRVLRSENPCHAFTSSLPC